MKFLERWKAWAQLLKLQAYTLYLACKDPRVPWYAKAFAACVAGYAFSPIDLIPDPIPVFRYLAEHSAENRRVPGYPAGETLILGGGFSMRRPGSSPEPDRSLLQGRQAEFLKLLKAIALVSTKAYSTVSKMERLSNHVGC